MLRPFSVLVPLLLIAQFLVGMAVNLFVTIPKHHPGARPPEYFSGAAQSVTWALVGSGLPWLVVHVVLGVVLGVLAIMLPVVALRSGRRLYAVASAFGLVGVVAAGSTEPAS